MQFLDLAGVKKFKQYIDENFTPIEDHENAEEVTAAALNDLNDRLTDVEGNTGEENVIEAITFNGSPATVANKTAAITATIPAEVTESTVSGWGFTKNTGTYSKPSSGIPATDLASAVQISLGKADTALQSFTETDPTVPAWAKQANKPTYTASEVGALPDTTVIPSIEALTTSEIDTIWS